MNLVKRSLCLVFILPIMINLYGCSSIRMYSGESLPTDQVAFLERGDLAQILISVDGHEKVNYFLLNKEVELLPGDHSIVVTYGDGSKVGFAYPLNFHAKAGTRYVLKSNFVDGRWRPHILDAKSGTIASEYPIYYIPMYGYPESLKTESQKMADDKFIKSVVEESGSRRKSAEEFAAQGWWLKRKGLVENSMRRFNQSWLLDKDYYQPYWGFGAISLVTDKPHKAAAYFEKALKLIGSNNEKPRLQVDTARAYALLAMKIKSTDVDKSVAHYKKADSLIKNALKLDPKYGNAYRIGSLNSYEQGDYVRTWEIVKKAHNTGNYSFSSEFLEKLSKKMIEPK